MSEHKKCDIHQIYIDAKDAIDFFVTEIEQLRARITELEGKTCENCAHERICDIKSIFNFGSDEGCSRFEPKKKD